jgi:hypothetical protein
MTKYKRSCRIKPLLKATLFNLMGVKNMQLSMISIYLRSLQLSHYPERLSRQICRVYDVKGVLTTKWWNHIFLLNSFRGRPSSRWATYTTRAIICHNSTCATNICEKLGFAQKAITSLKDVMMLNNRP